MSSLLSMAEEHFDALALTVHPGALVRHYGDDAVAWSPNSSTPLHLDALSALIWKLFDGETTVGEIVGDVTSVLGIPPVIARNRIRETAARLQGSALLAGNDTVDDESTEVDIFSAAPNT